MKLSGSPGKYLLPALAGMMLIFAFGYAIRSQRRIPFKPPPVTPATNPFGDVVAGTGFVEPSTDASMQSIISVGSQLSGVVVKVGVRVDQEVQEGDRLFELVKRSTTAELVLWQTALVTS